MLQTSTLVPDSSIRSDCPRSRWRFDATVLTLILRSCVARQESYIPGALSILPGTVPGRVRGSGHMVPTYFRRELRDRALQRPSRLRTFSFFVAAEFVQVINLRHSRHTPPPGLAFRRAR